MTATVKVWDIFVRLFHWSLVACFAIAWLSADEWDQLHELAGYIAAGLVACRLLWGVVGTPYARFTQFLRAPSTVAGYLVDIVKGREKRYLGHNPAGAAMIIALLLGIAGVAVTGWMMGLDAFWGVDWVEETHKTLANGMLALVALHVAGVLIASLRHHENLVRAMITGRKQAPGTGDIA